MNTQEVDSEAEDARLVQLFMGCNNTGHEGGQLHEVVLDTNTPHLLTLISRQPAKEKRVLLRLFHVTYMYTYTCIYLLPSGSEQHEVLLFRSI